MSPIRTSSVSCSLPSIIGVISTAMGATYERLRNLASVGKISCFAPSTSVTYGPLMRVCGSIIQACPSFIL